MQQPPGKVCRWIGISLAKAERCLCYLFVGNGLNADPDKFPISLQCLAADVFSCPWGWHCSPCVAPEIHMEQKRVSHLVIGDEGCHVPVTSHMVHSEKRCMDHGGPWSMCCCCHVPAPKLQQKCHKDMHPLEDVLDCLTMFLLSKVFDDIFYLGLPNLDKFGIISQVHLNNLTNLNSHFSWHTRRHVLEVCPGCLSPWHPDFDVASPTSKWPKRHRKDGGSMMELVMIHEFCAYSQKMNHYSHEMKWIIDIIVIYNGS